MRARVTISKTARRESGMDYTYDDYRKSADYILQRAGFVPEIAIVLGSCLGPFAQRIEQPVVIPYSEIPNFLISTAPSHAGKLVLGTVGGKRVVCMAGRFHHYEGYTYEQLAIPVRVFKCLGVKAVILTNAAGAINLDYKPGDVMVIRDHIKLFGDSPLTGRNIEEFGERFPSMTETYTQDLRTIALKCAESSSLKVHEGVYFFFPGPQFETASEIRAARILGGDAAGMSTVPDAITAAHCGMPLLALSVMVNMAAGIGKTPITQEQIDSIGEMIAGGFSDYVESIIREITV